MSTQIYRNLDITRVEIVDKNGKQKIDILKHIKDKERIRKQLFKLGYKKFYITSYEFKTIHCSMSKKDFYNNNKTFKYEV